jgi:hypothetical protein
MRTMYAAAMMAAITASAAIAGLEYRIDDGGSELGVGYPFAFPPGYSGDVSMTVINGFTAVAGGERITDVYILTPASIYGGTLTAYVWSGGATPTNATGAVLQSSATITTPAASQNIFIDVPDVDFTAGDVFFVGMQFTYTGGSGPSVLFGLLDRDGTDNGYSYGLQNSSFITTNLGGPIDHSVLNPSGLGSVIPNGNWILRAYGDPIPAPAALTPLLGLSGMGRRRR